MRSSVLGLIPSRLAIAPRRPFCCASQPLICAVSLIALDGSTYMYDHQSNYRSHTNYSDPYHLDMPKAPIQSPSLSTLVGRLDLMIGPGRRFASINAMAVALGMHATTLRRYMSMESDITLSMLDHIADGLGIPAGSLLDPASDQVEPAHELVLASLKVLRSLPPSDLERVFQLLMAYAFPSKVRLENPASPVDLDALTVPHSAPEDRHTREGVTRSAVGQHPRKRTR